MLLRSLLSSARKSLNSAGFCSLQISKRIATNPEKSHLSHSSAEEKSPQSTFLVSSYLINSCGLSPENAVTASKKLHFDSPEKPDSVVNFLEKSGFSKSQIAKLVRTRPQILVANIEKTLSPKIEFYLNNTVLQASDVCKLVTTDANFLLRNLERVIGPVYSYLKDAIGAERAGSLLKRGSRLFMKDLEKRIFPNIEFLRQIGLPHKSLQYGLANCPDVFCSRLNKLTAIVDEVRGMGFDMSKMTFVLALNARTNIKSWDRSYKVYKRWGFSEDDIQMAYMKHPFCMLISEKKISTGLDLLVNNMGREAREVAECPTALFFSTKRLLPRCSVIRLLCSKGLVKENWSISSAFYPIEKVFLKRYVERHSNELPQLYDVYRSSKEKGMLV